MAERETVARLPFAADCCPCEEKLRTVLPLTVGIGGLGGAPLGHPGEVAAPASPVNPSRAGSQACIS
jgi:hypothetical protein